MYNTLAQVRPDADIEEDLREFIRSYDPLKQARSHFSVEVHNGKITVKGHVRSIQAQRVLQDNFPDIEGVTELDTDELYNDEDLKRMVGKSLPSGILARVNYGHVTLYGQLPKGVDIEAIIENVKALSGVRHDSVKTQFI